MAATRKFVFISTVISLGLLPAAASFAGPAGNDPCAIGKGVAASSAVYKDVNDNGVWNGTAGGDAVAVVNASIGVGTMILGDWNDDGVDDAGKQNGTIYSIDLNGNNVWNGNMGGDRSTNFAASFGAGVPLSGSFGGGADVIGTFVSNAFYLDVNGNGIWNGNAGGDLGTAFAAGAAPGGVSITGDWNGDGKDDPGKYVGTLFYIDLNGNGVWNGTAGGDRVTNFAASFGAGIPVAGNFDGSVNGSDEVGVYIPGTSQFLLDVNGNGIWNGNAGGDIGTAFAAFAGAGAPLVCDWNGDGTDTIGRMVGTNFYVDKNGNFIWNGNAGGDRQSNFAIGGVGTGLPGDWTP